MPSSKQDPTREQQVVVPVVSEEARPGVRRVPTGGVRVTKRIGEDEEILDQPLRSEYVEVRRIIRDEVVAGPLSVRHEGDTVIVPVVKEVLKTQKQFVLTEEIHVIKRVVEERHVERIVLKHEQAEVERLDAAGNPMGSAAVSTQPISERSPTPVLQRSQPPPPPTEEISLNRAGRILGGESKVRTSEKPESSCLTTSSHLSAKP